MTVSNIDRITRSLSDFERMWLITVVEMTANGPVSLRDLWRTGWFSEGSGRALVVQPARSSAFLYLSETSGDTRELVAEHTLSLAMLIEVLVAEGFAFRFQATGAQRAQVKGIGAIFQDPHVEMVAGRSRIVINNAGDYTEDPATILTPKGDVAYRSICLSQDAYELIGSATHGMLMLRAPERVALQAALTPPPAVSETKQPGALETDPCGAGQTATAAEVPASIHPPVGEGTPKDTSIRQWRVPLRTALIAAGVLMVGATLTAFASRWFTQPSVAGATAAPVAAKESSGVVGTASPAIASRGASALAAGSTGQAPAVNRVVATASSDTAIVSPAVAAAPASGPTEAIGVLPLRSGGDVAVGADSMPGHAHGLDVSQWSGGGKTGAEAVFAVVPRLDFAFARVAYGTRLDPEFNINWALMARRSMYRGGYLFLRLDEDPVEQVDVAVRAMGVARTHDLCLTVDFEEMSLDQQHALSVDQVQRTISTALEHASQTMKCTPVIYTNWYMGQQYLNSPAFARYPLWIADWTKAPQPRVPPAWTSFAFWQRSDHLNRSPDPADLDVFNGDAAKLVQFVRVADQRNSPAGQAAPKAPLP